MVLCFVLSYKIGFVFHYLFEKYEFLVAFANAARTRGAPKQSLR